MPLVRFQSLSQSHLFADESPRLPVPVRGRRTPKGTTRATGRIGRGGEVERSFRDAGASEETPVLGGSTASPEVARAPRSRRVPRRGHAGRDAWSGLPSRARRCGEGRRGAPKSSTPALTVRATFPSPFNGLEGETTGSQEPDDVPAALRDPDRLVRRRKVTVLRRGSTTDRQRPSVRRSSSSRGDGGKLRRASTQLLTRIGAPKSSSPGPWGDSKRGPLREGSSTSARPRARSRRTAPLAESSRRPADGGDADRAAPKSREAARPPTTGLPGAPVQEGRPERGAPKSPETSAAPAAELIGPTANRSSWGFLPLRRVRRGQRLVPGLPPPAMLRLQVFSTS